MEYPAEGTDRIPLDRNPPGPYAGGMVKAKKKVAWFRRPSAGKTAWRKMLEEVEKAGREGLTAKELADQLGVDPCGKDCSGIVDNSKKISWQVRRLQTWGMIRMGSRRAPGKGGGRPSAVYVVTEHGKQALQAGKKEESDEE